MSTLMGKRKIFLSTLAGLYISLMASCEGTTTYRFIVVNQSGQAVMTTAQSSPRPATRSDTLRLIPGEDTRLPEWDKLGGSKTPGSLVSWLEWAYFRNEPGDCLVKDRFLENKGEILTNRRIRIPADYLHEFRFTVLKSDFR